MWPFTNKKSDAIDCQMVCDLVIKVAEMENRIGELQGTSDDLGTVTARKVQELSTRDEHVLGQVSALGQSVSVVEATLHEFKEWRHKTGMAWAGRWTKGDEIKKHLEAIKELKTRNERLVDLLKKNNISPMLGVSEDNDIGSKKTP